MRWVAAFSAAGAQVARRILRSDDLFFLPDRLSAGEARALGRPSDWGARAMSEAREIVVIGSCGLACRLLCPHMQGKTKDPAVVVVDETAQWAVALLSGHLGGAVALARQLADQLGASAVITTATDNRGILAPDAYARAEDCAVDNPEKIVRISSALLEGRPVGWWNGRVTRPEGYSAPEECPERGVVETPLSCFSSPFVETLWLRPRVFTLGVGCRRGVGPQHLEERFRFYMDALGFAPLSVARLATIDVKKDEEGLLGWAKGRGLPLRFFSAEELKCQPGCYTSSDWVKAAVGVESVCERAVVAAGAALLVRKWACEGVTFALGIKKEWLDDWQGGDCWPWAGAPIDAYTGSARSFDELRRDRRV